MARRPDDTSGALIFQEGKNIEGEFYIIAVYDDPASCTISFSAYELENDCTYTYPMSYSEFDGLFKFDSELMNPSNVDGRFHWVIERLDFVQDHKGLKVLCLAADPTPEDDEQEEEVQQPKQQGVAPTVAGTGSVDALTRAKLLQELDTHDDEKLHRGLVRSEAARKKFISELFAKRQLEQLKAMQRLQKTDEERQARLAKLDTIKKQQQSKAQAHREKEEAKKSTQAQLEVLMRQKEAQAIRRLMQQKDEQDRGMGREKDAAKQRRKMQERSAAEVQAIENQRAQQLARKREEQVQKREAHIKQLSRKEAEEFRAEADKLREKMVRRREEKDNIIKEVWKEKLMMSVDKKRRVDEFLRLEAIRDSKGGAKDSRRALEERERWAELRAAEQEDREAMLQRRKAIHDKALMQWKVDLQKKAQEVKRNDERSKHREKKWSEKEHMENLRLRKFREQQFLDTMRERGRSFSPTRDGDEPEEDPNATQATMSPTAAASSALTKSFEQQERARRHAEREEKRKVEEAKKAKVDKLGAQNPNASEVLRIHDWRRQEDKKKEVKEHARLQRELAEEKAAKDAAQKNAEREERFNALEERRREASLERERRRNEACTQRIRGVPIGTALPLALVY